MESCDLFCRNLNQKFVSTAVATVLEFFVMKRVFLVGGLRSPIGSLGGSLSTIRADDLLSLVISGVMKKYSNIDWNKIGDVIIGCANQAGEDNRNIARMSSLLAGLPVEVPGKTVNRLCGSGLSSIIDAARYIQLGEAPLMLTGGVEHMTRGPYVFSKSSSPFDRNQKMYDTTFGWRFVNPKVCDIESSSTICLDLMPFNFPCRWNLHLESSQWVKQQKISVN
jgi:acetyl-CoA acetyltransferase